MTVSLSLSLSFLFLFLLIANAFHIPCCWLLQKQSCLLTGSFQYVTLSWGLSALLKPWRSSWGGEGGPASAKGPAREERGDCSPLVLLHALCACTRGQPLVRASSVTSRWYLRLVWIPSSVPSPITLARETQSCSGAGILEERGRYHRRGSSPLKDDVEPRERGAQSVRWESAAMHRSVAPTSGVSHPNCWALTLSRCATF